MQEISARSVLEHIDNLEELLCEFHRVPVPGSMLHIYVPHWGNPFYYSDYTHRQFFGLSTFDYFADRADQRYRKVPAYYNLRYSTVDVRLRFQSYIRIIDWLLKPIGLP